MVYTDVVNVVAPEDAILSGGAFKNTNNRRTAVVPTGKSYSLRADSLDSYKTPPDQESFRQIVKSGRVKMTEYEHYKERTSFSLVTLRYPIANAATLVYDWNGSYWETDLMEQNVGSYDFVTDFDRLLAFGVPHLSYSEPEDLRNVVKSNVVSDASHTLDLLTEFGERAGTIELILGFLKTAYRPLQSYKDARDWVVRNHEDPRKVADLIANLWLKYRYAISPLIYSIQDAVSVLNQQERIYDRSGSSIDAYGRFPQPVDNHLVDSGIMSVRYSAVTKSRFSSSQIGSADLIGFNPLRTGWELVPFSFVIDWFVNVGSWLESITFSLFDLAQERKFCVSTKRTYRIETTYHWRTPDLPEVVVESSKGTYHNVPSVPGYSGSGVVRTIEGESYRRDLFTPSDVSFDLSPYLNWERWLDGIALSVKPLNKALRRLRK